jgi:hypothetical protein
LSSDVELKAFSNEDVEKDIRMSKAAALASATTTIEPQPLRIIMRPFVAAALALTASVGMLHPSAAAEIDLSGTGTFKPLSDEKLAGLPADLAFTRSDLASGKWSFFVRYEERTADADADPFVGRYAGAIRVFRVTVGSTTVELPVDQAQLAVSDGGLGFAHRESIRLEATSVAPYGLLRVGWVQLNQHSSSDDLRGAGGALPGDSIPMPSTIAELATSSPFDRYLQLRIDRPGDSRPLLYLSSSKVSVTAGSAVAR